MTAHKSFIHNFQTYFFSALHSLKSLPAVLPQGYSHSCFSSFLLVFSCLPPTHSICQTISQLLNSYPVSGTPLPFCSYHWVPPFLQQGLFLLFITIAILNLVMAPFSHPQGRLKYDSFKYVSIGVVMQVQTRFNTAQFRNCHQESLWMLVVPIFPLEPQH